MEEIHSEVMTRRWSEDRQSFRQQYDTDTLDASVLLACVMEFLPPDHPRIVSTVQRIEESLTIDGFVHRYEPEATPDGQAVPLGEHEGAFLACTFWLATAWAKAGRPDRAEAVLDSVEAIAGPVGLLAEEADARTRTFLGNTPLLFSHAEYVRVALEIAQARLTGKVQLAMGKAKRWIKSGK